MSYHPAVPILDEAWMENRRQWREWQARYRVMDHMFGKPDTAESLRDDYAAGKITFETFERRLGEVIGCA